MKTSIITSRNSALLAAWSLILMAVMAGFAFGYLRSLTFTPEDPNLAFSLLQSEPWWILLELGAWTLILVLDILVAWALWQLFKVKQSRRAGAVFILRVLYSLVLGIAIVQLLPLAGGAVGLSADATLMIRADFDRIWSYGLMIFGLHLVVLGQAVQNDLRMPRLWAYLLYIAGGSYTLLNGLIQFTQLPKELLDTLENILVFPMTVGELGFAFWLLWAARRKRI